MVFHMKFQSCLLTVVSLLTACCLRQDLYAGNLWVGTAHVSLTPDKPVAIMGQFSTRISIAAESPVTATALALETRNGNQIEEQAIFISCDLCILSVDIQQKFREHVKSQLPGFDINKVFLNATHTHTSPVMREGIYTIPEDGVMQPAEYVDFVIARLTRVATEAWNHRQPGGVSWGMGHAVVAYNRRTLYANGKARMYGPTNTAAFRGIEGYEDHGVEVLFFWNKENKLIATSINVACPAQEVESRRAINADYWHEVRLQLKKQYGDHLHVLGWIGAAGDQSPHLRYRKKAEDRMRQARGLTRLQEIARRICRAFDDAYEVARADIRQDVIFRHLVKNIELPARLVTKAEYQEAKAIVADLEKQAARGEDVLHKRYWHQMVVDRFEKQVPNQTYPVELHIIRLGDVAICSNPFELFTMYGIQIKARSQAVQTFVIQLACSIAGYLPTQKAVDGGGYSAIVQSNLVGPEGGQVLVDETVDAINGLWNKQNATAGRQ